MTIFSATNISKTYQDKTLFTELSFGLDAGERVGLIGRNGAGKTTLLKIIAGREYPDRGEITFNKDVRFEFLEQMPVFEGSEILLDAVMAARGEVFEMLNEYRGLCSLDSESGGARLQQLALNIDQANGWNLENEAKAALSQLGIEDFYCTVDILSGGLRKRVALARALISDPDLLILDEPTNHLDADSVQWMQDRLMNSPKSLLFVTHDRYFLDAVSTRIIEIDRKRIFSYPGNFERYLELKESFVSTEESTIEHLRSRLRTELAWLQKGAKARRSKQKSRIDWIEKLREETIRSKEKKIKIELGTSFLGSRIIDAHNIGKSLGGKLLFRDFTYLAKRKDRIGIIGPNGSGKSTLLNVLAGNCEPDEGHVRIGPSVKTGFFTQEIENLPDTQSVLGVLREVAEYIDVGVGRDRYITARDLLNKFLFPPKQHSALISTLSGGEKRRLALLRLLMGNPNVIMLDEPTNDFDIQTLGALEDYLDDFYGTLLVVSHDRAFLDRTVNFIFSFDGNGNIREYPGNYSAYLEKKEAAKKAARSTTQKTSSGPQKKPPQKKQKLSYKEQRELDLLGDEIPILESEIGTLEEILSSSDGSDYKKLQELSNNMQKLKEAVEEKTMRWLELSEMKDKLENGD